MNVHPTSYYYYSSSPSPSLCLCSFWVLSLSAYHAFPLSSTPPACLSSFFVFCCFAFFLLSCLSSSLPLPPVSCLPPHPLSYPFRSLSLVLFFFFLPSFSFFPFLRFWLSSFFLRMFVLFFIVFRFSLPSSSSSPISLGLPSPLSLLAVIIFYFFLFFYSFSSSILFRLPI